MWKTRKEWNNNNNNNNNNNKKKKKKKKKKATFFLYFLRAEIAVEHNGDSDINNSWQARNSLQAIGIDIGIEFEIRGRIETIPAIAMLRSAGRLRFLETWKFSL